MSNDDTDDDDWDDDASWADDDRELDDVGDLDEDGRCPECGALVHSITDKCPTCGYWLTDADHHSMRPGTAKPLWLRVTAAVLLAALMMGLLSALSSVF